MNFKQTIIKAEKNKEKEPKPRVRFRFLLAEGEGFAHLAVRPGAQPAGLVQFAEAAVVSQRNRRKPLTPVRASALESLTKSVYNKKPNENNPVRFFGGR